MDIPKRIATTALGLPFIWLGYEAVKDPGNRVNLAKTIRMPQPEAAVRFNGAAMALGGLGLVTGVLPRPAAAGLVVSLIPTTLAGHAYWNHTDPQARKANRTQLLKNLGLIGGLLSIACSSAGGECARESEKMRGIGFASKHRPFS
jgi:putative oxidoreductase